MKDIEPILRETEQRLNLKPNQLDLRKCALIMDALISDKAANRPTFIP